jgi:hypothetical protein
MEDPDKEKQVTLPTLLYFSTPRTFPTKRTEAFYFDLYVCKKNILPDASPYMSSVETTTSLTSVVGGSRHPRTDVRPPEKLQQDSYGFRLDKQSEAGKKKKRWATKSHYPLHAPASAQMAVRKMFGNIRQKMCTIVAAVLGKMVLYMVR